MKVKRVGVLTSGGDAPGMNAAIRAVVRSANYFGLDAIGIRRGYAGLIEGNMDMLDSRSVSGIINKGGTILHTVRCPQFRQRSFRKQAYGHLKKNRIDALVIIGGDGSLHGSLSIYRESGIPCMVIPATIDNDLPRTDYTIGFDTAVNTAVEAIDKIRDTATSHERLFIVEVMGREHGFLALEVGIVSGAEIILIPEIKYSLPALVDKIERGISRGKASGIIVMAEGAGRSLDISDYISKKIKREVRISILGHVQRGGTPSAFSRGLAERFGLEAVRLLTKGRYNRMVGMQKGIITSTPIAEVLRTEKLVNPQDYKLAQIMAI